MVEPLTSANIRLSPENLKRIRDSEDAIVQSLILDLDSHEASVRKEARNTLIKLGFTHRKDKAKEVVALLLEKARAGAFGEQARSFQNASERSDEAEDEPIVEDTVEEEVEEEVEEKDPYLEQIEKDEKEAPVSKMPLVAADAVPKPDEEPQVDSFASMAAEKKRRRPLRPESKPKPRRPKVYNFGEGL